MKKEEETEVNGRERKVMKREGKGRKGKVNKGREKSRKGGGKCHTIRKRA